MKGEIHDERSNVDRTKKVKKEKSEIEEIEVSPAAVEKSDQELLKEAEEREKARKEAEDSEKEEAKEAEKIEKSKELQEKKARKATVRIKPRHGKKYLEIAKKIEIGKEYSVEEAIDLLLTTNISKFDATCEFHAKLHIKEVNVRGMVQMPGGLVKEKKILEVDEKNIDQVVENIKAGKIDFDIMVASIKVMPKLAGLAKVLGPKGLMPSPKAGTIVTDVKAAAAEMRSGRVEYRADKFNIVHMPIGRVSFGAEKIRLNFDALVGKLPKRIESIYLTTTMGPSIKVSKK